MPTFTLSEINIYPVKSLAGIQVNSWEVNQKGLLYDRHWMIIDRNNRFLSQRQLPRMCLIQTTLGKTRLTLSTSSEDRISIPLASDSEQRIETTIWKDQCTAQHVSKEVDQWLSDFLHYDCRLVCQTEQHRRVDPNYAAPEDQVSFTDGFPFLIISESSLAALNQQLPHKIPMSSFRPNLVIAGCDSYAEDYWRKISIGEINFRLPKPCSRCLITTIDTQTAQTSKEPLKTLNKLRKWNREVFFGQNALHDKTGKLAIGDPVTILQSGPPQPPIKNHLQAAKNSV